MLYEGIKVMAHSPGGDTDYFDIVTEVLKRDISAPFLFKIFLGDVP